MLTEGIEGGCQRCLKLTGEGSSVRLELEEEESLGRKPERTNREVAMAKAATQHTAVAAPGTGKGSRMDGKRWVARAEGQLEEAEEERKKESSQSRSFPQREERCRQDVSCTARCASIGPNHFRYRG